MVVGVVDVGTNSLHLLIGRVSSHGIFHQLLHEHELARLGAGGLRQGRLAAPAKQRAYEVLGRYAATMTRFGVERVEAVATSAVREADNGAAFVRQVRRTLRLPLRIISGRDEARLGYLGVLHAHRLRQAAVLIAIGGGSAQVVCADGARVRVIRSAPLGGARLAQRFIRHDPARPAELQALRAHLETAWKPIARAVRPHPWRVALGCSATIHQLLAVSYQRTHHHPPKRGARVSIRRAALLELVAWLSGSTAPQRRRLPGLDPAREDLALPTAMALLTWMEACDVPEVRYASGSIREGLVMELIRRTPSRGPAVLLPT